MDSGQQFLGERQMRIPDQQESHASIQPGSLALFLWQIFQKYNQT